MAQHQAEIHVIQIADISENSICEQDLLLVLETVVCICFFLAFADDELGDSSVINQNSHFLSRLKSSQIARNELKSHQQEQSHFLSSQHSSLTHLLFGKPCTVSCCVSLQIWQCQ